MLRETLSRRQGGGDDGLGICSHWSWQLYQSESIIRENFFPQTPIYLSCKEPAGEYSWYIAADERLPELIRCRQPSPYSFYWSSENNFMSFGIVISVSSSDRKYKGWCFQRCRVCIPFLCYLLSELFLLAVNNFSPRYELEKLYMNHCCTMLIRFYQELKQQHIGFSSHMLCYR